MYCTHTVYLQVPESARLQLVALAAVEDALVVKDNALA